MGIAHVLVLGLALAAPQGRQVPTPDMAMTFSIEKDPREWDIQFTDLSESNAIAEMVPQGDSVKAWKELVSQQIAFTHAPLREYVDLWKAMLLQADPKIDLREEVREDGSIVVVYTSTAANETSIRRFIPGSDGVYMLAYHVRPKLKDDKTFNTWWEIINAAELIPNPQKQR